MNEIMNTIKTEFLTSITEKYKKCIFFTSGDRIGKLVKLSEKYFNLNKNHFQQTFILSLNYTNKEWEGTMIFADLIKY